MTTQQAEAAPALATAASLAEAPAASEAVETPQKPAAPAEDWKAKFEASEKARLKVENDYKAHRNRQAPLEQLAEKVDRIEACFAMTQGVLKALAPEEAARIEADLNAAQGRSQLNETFLEQMNAAISDDDGNFVLPEGSPELVALQKAYATAHGLGADTAGIRARMRAVQLASLTVQKYVTGQIAAQAEAQEKSHQAALTEAEKRGEAKAKAAYVAKVEVAPGGVNGAGGGVAPTKDNIDKLFIDGKVSPDIYRKFLETGNI